jgi:hypothetical protein
MRKREGGAIASIFFVPARWTQDVAAVLFIWQTQQRLERLKLGKVWIRRSAIANVSANDTRGTCDACRLEFGACMRGIQLQGGNVLSRVSHARSGQDQVTAPSLTGSSRLGRQMPYLRGDRCGSSKVQSVFSHADFAEDNSDGGGRLLLGLPDTARAATEVQPENHLAEKLGGVRCIGG